jgi:acyl-CoA thioesterase-2
VGQLPDDERLHRNLLAYASDFFLLGTTMLPHGISEFEGRLVMSSLDHAMWFHRPLRVDDWLLYAMESPSASGARGFAQAGVFSRDGRLVATIAQEGLVRIKRGK